MVGIRVRKFEPRDAGQVSELMKQAFRSFLGDRMTSRREARFSPARLRKSAHSKGPFSEAVSLVALDGSKVVGYIRVTASEGGLGSLEVVGTDPGYFGTGVGRALMEGAEKFWRRKKMRKVSTCVSAHNRRALIYYIRNGFFPEGYRRDHFFEGVDEVILGRFL